MPVYRIAQGEEPAQAVEEVITTAEKNGESVVGVTEIGNEWIVVTRPAPRAPKNKTRVETRAR